MPCRRAEDACGHRGSSSVRSMEVGFPAGRSARDVARRNVRRKTWEVHHVAKRRGPDRTRRAWLRGGVSPPAADSWLARTDLHRRHTGSRQRPGRDTVRPLRRGQAGERRDCRRDHKQARGREELHPFFRSRPQGLPLCPAQGIQEVSQGPSRENRIAGRPRFEPVSCFPVPRSIRFRSLVSRFAVRISLYSHPFYVRSGLTGRFFSGRM
jgi:hypothetical protein